MKMRNSIIKILTALKSPLRGFGGFILYVVLTSSSGGSTPAWQQENVSFPMMNLEIKATMDENGRQKEMRKNQIANATVETANKTQWNKFQGQGDQNSGQA
jgi:hypothetical protein